MTAVLLIPFLLMGVAFVIGTQQPATRQVSRTIEVRATPVAIRDLLVSPQRQADWWDQIELVEPLEERPGTFRQIFPEGRSAHVTVAASGPSEASSVVPLEVVWQIADPAGPYRGTWRFTIGAPEASPESVAAAGSGAESGSESGPPGTHVTLVEEARLGNPFARLLVAWAGGGGDLVDDCLHDLAAWFEQEAGSATPPRASAP